MPVASERFSSKGLGEVVSRIVATRERYKVVGSKILVLSQKMVADVDVFHTSMVDRVFGALDAGSLSIIRAGVVSSGNPISSRSSFR